MGNKYNGFIFAFLLALNLAAAVVTAEELIVTPYDKIPNFGANPNIYAIANGNWSNVSVWSAGRLPTTGDIVSINDGFTVTYDMVSDTPLDTVIIQAGGHLIFRTDISTRLTVVNFLVLGELQIGSQATPVPANVTAVIQIANVAINTSKDPEQWGNGLIALGKVTMAGASRTPFVRLGVEPRVGDTTLTLAEPVTGWQAGDQLFLPDSRQVFYYESVDQRESFSLAGVSADGKTLTLASPLRFGHPGGRDPDGRLRFLPHVGNTTRNVMVKSQSAIGTRGYVLFTHRADVDVRSVRFGGLGRTRMNPGDETTFDASGRVIHIGTNQRGREPVVFRHLIGPTTIPANGYQFTFSGNSIVCPLNPMPFRGMTIEDSHYGLLSQNVALNWARWGIATVGGNESYNVIEKNFVVQVTDSEGFPDPNLQTSGADRPSGIWLRGPNNYVRDNVVANVGSERVNGGDGLTLFAKYAGEVPIPTSKGAVPSVLVDMNARPMLEFARNEAYATSIGVSVWGLGVLGDEVKPISGETVVKDLAVWNIYDKGFYVYESNRLTIDGMIGRGDVNKLVSNIGVWGDDYLSKDFTVKNADLQGFSIGYAPPMETIGTMAIRDSYLRNGINIDISTLTTNHYRSDYFGPRRTVINNVRFAGLPGIQTTNISMSYFVSGGVANFIQRDEVFVYNYDGVAGDNFRVYYNEQRAGFIVPQRTTNPEDGTTRADGSPEAGLTNEQNWNKYVYVAGADGYFARLRTPSDPADLGLAIAGAVAPADATTRSFIYGLVK